MEFDEQELEIQKLKDVLALFIVATDTMEIDKPLEEVRRRAFELLPEFRLD